MDLESVGGMAGSGAGGGIIGVIIAFFGFNRRINKLEDGKQDKFACLPIHKGIDDKFDTILNIVKEIKDGQNKMWDKLSERRTEYRE